jgi:DNA-binding NtrC family response regulator/tetratricopeptide (TPR) repeat protein
MEELRELLGSSPAIERLRATIAHLASRSSAAARPPAILITGETGTGKGLVARLLHRLGPRAAGPFVDVNCAAIPDTLMEAELFGFERGAFTDARRSKPGLFQTAHGGTIFLDEVGLLNEALQAKLLTVIEERVVRRLGATRGEPVDACIISATNADLALAIRERRFREDLYHRLAVVTLPLPPLRERDGDVVLLAEHFLARACRDYGLPTHVLASDARRRLVDHAWPGNVRELANVMERAALMAGSTHVTAVTLEVPDARPPAAAATTPTPPVAGATSLDDAMRTHMQAVLNQCGGNVSRAAALLGISRNTLTAHVEKFGLHVGPARRGRRPRGSTSDVAVSREAPTGDATPEAADEPPQAVPAVPAVAGLRWTRRLVALARIGLDVAAETAAFQLAPLLQELIATARGFGGRVDALTPDGLVATFGMEVLEDAPRRAVYAVMAMMKRVEREQAPGAAAIEARGAVHVTWSLMASGADVSLLDARVRRESDAALDALLAGAGAGTIIVSKAAANHLERRFEVTALDGASDGPAQRFRLTGLERTGFEVGGRLSRFVGRERDLALLADLLARVEDGSGQVVGIVGEAGIGKSRLLHEFRALTVDRVTFLTGRCLTYGGTAPYLPILDIIRDTFGLLATDDVKTTTAKLESGIRRLAVPSADALPLLLHLLGFKPGTESLAGQSPQALQARAVEVLKDIGLRAGRRRPIVCAVEDLHWIDDASEAVLAALAESLAGSRILLVATYRPGLKPPWAGRSYASQISLARLSQAESLAVLEAVAGAAMSDDLAQRIARRAEGVPFFLEELARAATETRTPGAPMPETIEAALVERLQRLPLDDLELLQVAAVVGQDARVPILAGAVARSEAEIEPGLTRLQAAEFLRVAVDDDGPTYAFKHALTHEVAYRSLSGPRRVSLHAATAGALERLAPEIADRRPEMVAHHLTEGDRLDAAVPYWLRAGQLAVQRSANVEAIAHLTRGLALLQRLPAGQPWIQQELMLRLSLTRAYAAHHGYAAEAVGTNLARVRVIADELGESPELMPVRYGLWLFHLSRAQLAAAEELADRMLAAAGHQAEGPLAVAAHVASGVVRFYRGDLVTARARLERAVDLHRPEYAPVQAAAYGQDLGVGAASYLAWVLALAGEPDRAMAEAERALSVARRGRHAFSVALALLGMGLVACERREPARAASAGEELLALSQEQGFRFFVALALGFCGWAAFAVKDRARGLALMQEGVASYRDASQRVGLRLGVQLAEALAESGRPEEALTTVEEGLVHAAAADDRALLSELHRIKGEVLGRRRPPDPAAEAALETALAIAEGQGATLLALRAATSLCRFRRERGDVAVSLSVLRAIVARFREGLELPDLAQARRLLESDGPG